MRVPSLLIFHVGRIFYGAASELLTKSLCLPTVFTPAATPAKWVARIDACPRSFVAATPEGWEFTSIYQRIREIRAEPTPSTEPDAAPQIPLMSFQSGPTHVPVLPYRFQDYLSLVD
jgi:hypothetical protein